MNGIQIILILGVLGITIYYFLRFRNAFLDFLLLLLFTVLAIFFIVFPEYTNIIANRLGVGRGADMLFYLCILFFIFVIIKLYSRIRRLEEKFTEFVRTDAEKNAINPKTDNQKTPVKKNSD